MRTFRFMAGSMLVLLLLIGSSANQTRDEYFDDVRKNLNRFGEVYRSLAFRYVDQIDPEASIEAAIQGLMNELDPYTDYFIDEAAQDLEDISRGQYGGFGMEVGLRGSEKRITVISPFEGTPAWEAGMQPGDIIDEVEGKSTRDRKLSDVVKLIKGEPGTPVRLSILRPGYSDPLDYELTRALITIRDVKFAGIVDEDDGLGYIRMVRFSGKATESLRVTLEELLEQNLRRLILDLRGNPGGLLQQAAGVADLFLPEGTRIVSTRGRNGELVKDLAAQEPALFEGELVVLINQGSASASEIVAGALQDHDRAVVVGQQSYGKGLVQSVVDLDKEAKIKLTTARYYLPSGRLIQRIDYFEDNEVLDHDEPGAGADSLYYTMSGRRVIGGRGINPDHDTEPARRPHFINELWRKALFANFVADLEREGREPAGLEVDRKLLREFRKYLDDTGFEYQPNGGGQLDKLAEIIELESYGSPAERALRELREAISSSLDSQFDAHREWLELMLELELSDRRHGPDARLLKGLEQDEQYQAARALLSTDDMHEYHAILVN